MIRKLSTALAALVLALVPFVASAQVAPGTELYGNIKQTLDSGSAYVGQPFTLSGVHSSDNTFNGGTIYGHVAAVQKASQGRPGRIDLAFDRLVTSGGASYAIAGRATHVQVNTKSNALKEAGGALAGMLIGNYLGKVVGTNIGGAVGAAGGYVVAKNNKQNVTIPDNSQVSVQVLRSRRQASRG
jgi:hypothetical protein